MAKSHELNTVLPENTAGIFGPVEFKQLVELWGITSGSPKGRVEELKSMDVSKFVYFISDLNRSLQGEPETQISPTTMKYGDDEMVPVEDRYDLFMGFFDKLAKLPEDINPERVGDALAMVVGMLHPFNEANGRTGRALSLVFHSNFDSDDYVADYKELVVSRDAMKEAGMQAHEIVAPYIRHKSIDDPNNNVDMKNPGSVSRYFEQLLTSEDRNLYTGPFGYAPLKEAA